MFPIVASWTLDVLGREGHWGRILDDLRRDETPWSILEQWFRDLPLRQDEPVLTRLRLYDILLWSRVAEQSCSRAGGCGRRCGQSSAALFIAVAALTGPLLFLFWRRPSFVNDLARRPPSVYT